MSHRRRQRWWLEARLIVGGTDRAQTRRDAGQQGDVGPSGSGAGASQHRAVGGPQHGAASGASRPAGVEGGHAPHAPARSRRVAPPIRPPVARIDPSARQRAPAAEGLPLLAEAGRRCDAEACGGARGARARARRARHGVRGVRVAASAGGGSACGGSRASGHRRWSTPSVRAPVSSAEGCSERVGRVSGSHLVRWWPQWGLRAPISHRQSPASGGALRRLNGRVSPP